MRKNPRIQGVSFAVLLCFFLTGLTPFPAAASLKHYVTKYREIQVTADQQKRLSRYNYLIKYFSAFSYFKRRHKVNPDFIRALVIAESNAYPRAKSDKNALGLTQITYETGKQAASELARKNVHFRYVSKKKLKYLRPNDLYNPAVNILLACYLIAKYNAQHKGKLDLVVSAWNAGEYSIINNRPAQNKETLNHIGKVNGYFVYFLNQKKRKKYTYRRY